MKQPNSKPKSMPSGMNWNNSKNNTKPRSTNSISNKKRLSISNGPSKSRPRKPKNGNSKSNKEKNWDSRKSNTPRRKATKKIKSHWNKVKRKQDKPPQSKIPNMKERNSIEIKRKSTSVHSSSSIVKTSPKELTRFNKSKLRQESRSKTHSRRENGPRWKTSKSSSQRSLKLTSKLSRNLTRSERLKIQSLRLQTDSATLTLSPRCLTQSRSCHPQSLKNSKRSLTSLKIRWSTTLPILMKGLRNLCCQSRKARETTSPEVQEESSTLKNSPALSD